MDLIWEDHFDGPAGATPDATHWNVETGNADTGGWGNQELQLYTGNSDNLALDGAGNLAIIARPAPAGIALPCWNGEPCPYTSARITTRGKVELTYGRVEARIRMPAGTGVWPAFWMLGEPTSAWPACGEIDVMELIGSEPDTVYGTIHGPGYSGRAGLQRRFDRAGGLCNVFHTFAVEKQPGRIQWFVDDHEFMTMTPESLPDCAEWVFERAYYLLLNLAIGGWWPGPPTPETRFPATMLIDYVRMYGDAI